MNTIGHLLYFLNSTKQTLSFNDIDEFISKIKTDFNFRLKVQKFVYISKYFGWEHPYNYSLYIRGPYSSTLADDYYNEDIANYSSLKINGFDVESFNSFVKDKSISYLESASTILYFMNQENNISRSDMIDKLYEIKPHITSDIVRNAYDDIINRKSFQEKDTYEIIIVDDNNDLNEKKNLLLEKINYYINYFEDFGECNNSIIISGTLDYLRIVLIHEKLNNTMKQDLLELILKYTVDIKKIYNLCDNNEKTFINLNLDDLENFFDRIQDYISEELNIIPRLDDDEFEYCVI